MEPMNVPKSMEDEKPAIKRRAISYKERDVCVHKREEQNSARNGHLFHESVGFIKSIDIGSLKPVRSFG